MFKAVVLVRNFQPNASAVDFREFSVEQIGSKFTKLREDLSSSDVNPGDWILEKHYLAPRQAHLAPLLEASRTILRKFYYFSAFSGRVTSHSQNCLADIRSFNFHTVP
jgi:hypothetical protein